MTNKYKNKITKTNDFRVICKSIVSNVLSVNIPSNINRIYIDLNSVVSIIFRYEDIGNDGLQTNLSDNLEAFLTDNITNGRELIFLYTTENSKVHTTIYPNWCNERSERVKLVSSEFLKKFILSIAKFAKLNKLVKICNTRDVHPVMVIDKLEEKKNTKFMILSKDNVMMAYNNHRSVVFTGRKYCDRDDKYRPLPDDIVLEYPDTDLTFYLVIKGDTRNEYRGIPGYGVKNTIKYVTNNRVSIRMNKEHTLKEEFDRLLPLYDVKKMREFYGKDFEVKIT